MDKIVVFHGTHHTNISSIMKEGLRKGSFVAWHMEDALKFGGEFILRFEIPMAIAPGIFPYLERKMANWQLMCHRVLPADYITNIYKVKVIG